MIDSEKPKSRLVVVMPVYNESQGIIEFLNELASSLTDFNTTFIVVDDCSTDNTFGVLSECSRASGPRLQVFRNPRNLGHGESTLLALKLAIQARPDFVLAADGDGHIRGVDAQRLVARITEGGFAVCEGVRIGRSEAKYRKVISVVTRVLVRSRSKESPRDANTPFRAYQYSALSLILSSDNVFGCVPNLRISEFCRRSKMLIDEVEVEWRPRFGGRGRGSTSWGKENRYLPSKKLLIFCVKAGNEWLFGKKKSN